MNLRKLAKIPYKRSFGTDSGKEQILLERNPKLYLLPDAAKNILKVNPNIKIVLVVCDNVRRLISEYSKLRVMSEKEVPSAKMRLRQFGQSMDEFVENLTKSMTLLRNFFEKTASKNNQRSFVAQKYVNNSATEPIEEKIPKILDDRFEEIKNSAKRSLPGESTLQSLIFDGLYSYYHKSWTDSIPVENLHVFDGSQLNSAPASEFERLQEFMNIEPLLTSDNFTIHPQRKLVCLKGHNGMPCCTGKDKGRSVEIRLSPEAENSIRKFYSPFDNHLSKKANIKMGWLRADDLK